MDTEFDKIVQLIRGIYNSPKDFIPLHTPIFKGNEKKYLEECIDTTFVSSVGKFVDQFENQMATFTGSTKAVSCVNGTNALHLALQLVDVKQDTEVITQPLTFIATANAIAYCGALPVFLDVDMDTMGLSPKALKNWLKQNVELREVKVKGAFSQPKPLPQPQPYNRSTGRRISSCVPMHTFGHPCRIAEIVDICKAYNIPVIEDAAESLGSYYKGKHTGTFGKIGILSFNGNKVLTTGGGGMLLFQDEELAKRAKHLTTQAKVPHPWKFNHDAVGYNYRMPNINAALGLAQLEQLPKFLESKRKIAESYKHFFSIIQSPNANQPSVFISEPLNSLSNYWLNCVLFSNREERDAFLKYSNEKGVMTRPAWTLMNELKMFKDCETDELLNARNLSNRLVNLPSSAIKQK